MMFSISERSLASCNARVLIRMCSFGIVDAGPFSSAAYRCTGASCLSAARDSGSNLGGSNGRVAAGTGAEHLYTT